MKQVAVVLGYEETFVSLGLERIGLTMTIG